MIFIKYALLVFALLSISTSMPMKNVSPEIPKPELGPAAASFKPLQQPETQSGLKPGAVYLENSIQINSPDLIKMVPVVCLGPATDDKGHLIPGEIDVVGLTERNQEKHLLVLTTLGYRRFTRRYFRGSFQVLDEKTIYQFNVDISQVKHVKEGLIEKKILGETTNDGFQKLQQDINTFMIKMNGKRPLNHGPK